MTLISRTLQVATKGRSQMIDVTGELRKIVGEEKIEHGRMTVSVPHTTAGVTINEHADPAVAEDILRALDRMVPWESGWRHAEGNSAAHIKTVLVGSSVTVRVADGELDLGTWQGVFLCEFDGPRRRQMRIMCETGETGLQKTR